MIVGTCKVDLHLPGRQSLKGKRRVVNSIKNKICHKFNVSISEIESHDLWQRIVFGIVCVSNERKQVQQVLDNVINFIEKNRDVIIIDYQKEML